MVVVGIKIDDKDLPDVKPEDIKLDVTEVTKLDDKALDVKKQERGLHMVSNERLVELLEYYPKEIDRMQKLLTHPRNLITKEEFGAAEATMKEKYGLVLKEIETRKSKAKDKGDV